MNQNQAVKLKKKLKLKYWLVSPKRLKRNKTKSTLKEKKEKKRVQKSA